MKQNILNRFLIEEGVYNLQNLSRLCQKILSGQFLAKYILKPHHTTNKLLDFNSWSWNTAIVPKDKEKTKLLTEHKGKNFMGHSMNLKTFLAANVQQNCLIVSKQRNDFLPLLKYIK